MRVSVNATSRVNAAENGLSEVFVAELPDEEAAREAIYPIVLANILAGTLIELSELLASRVAVGGTIIMSGIWEADQVERVQAAYVGKGLSAMEVSYAEGGWALLQATRVE